MNKKIFIAIFCMLMLVATVSAWEFDNRKSYDWDTQRMTIKNSFGLGADLATIELVDYTGTCFPDDCWMYMDVKVNKKGLKSLKYARTYFMDGGEKATGNQYQIWDTTTPYEVTYEKFNCPKTEANRKNPACYVDITETRYGQWVDYDTNTELSPEIYKFRVKVNVNAGETVDVIPNFYGLDLTEWAVFSGLERFEYYNIGADDNGWIDSNGGDGNSWQTFTVGANSSNESYSIRGIAIETISCDAETVIYAHLFDAPPNLTSIYENYSFAHGELNVSTTPNAWQNISLTTNYTIDAGGFMAIYINSTAGDQSCGWREDRSTAGYLGGNRGNGVEVGSNQDTMFEIWGIAENPVDVNATLIAPADALNTSYSTVEFKANGTVTKGNFTNATLFIWNDTATFNRTTFNINGTFNETVINVSLDVTNYTWTFEFCGINATAQICDVPSANRTIDFDTIVLSQVYTNTTEGNTERFEINVSIPDDVGFDTANLIYNWTSYNSTIDSIEGNNYSIYYSIETPAISKDSNISFYWNLNYDDSTEYNTSHINQSVLSIALDNCTTNPLIILNYTLRDEGSQAVLTSADNITIDVDIDLSTIGTTNEIKNFSQTFNNTNPVQVCLPVDTLNDTSYRMDTVVKYFTEGREKEYHHIQNFTLNNNTIPQNIHLYDLLSADSQEFLITFKDTDFLPEADALVDITRNYVDEGTFKSVEVPKTDDDGRVVGHLVLSDIIYTIIVSKNGVVLGTFENVVAFCDDQSTGDCKINLNAFSSSTDPSDFTTLDNLTYTFSFNETAREVKVTFTTTDGASKTVNLTSTKFDNFANTTVCSDQLVSSSGTLTCTIPSGFGNVTVISELTADNDFVVAAHYSIEQDPEDILGENRVFVAMVLYLVLPLLLIGSPVLIVIGSMLAFILIGLLLILDTGSFFGEASVIIWFIIAGAILIWRINQKRGAV